MRGHYLDEELEHVAGALAVALLQRRDGNLKSRDNERRKRLEGLRFIIFLLHHPNDGSRSRPPEHQRARRRKRLDENGWEMWGNGGKRCRRKVGGERRQKGEANKTKCFISRKQRLIDSRKQFRPGTCRELENLIGVENLNEDG